MLRIIQNTSTARAQSYYTTSDYYTEGQELAGVWRGKGAARLCLSGKIEKQAWDALCNGRHPDSGAPLTVRQKDNRTVGYDFNFHVPKSVSLLFSLTQDERILNAFRESVDETMRDIEAEIKTRVRRGNKSEDRTSGNAVWGEYIHFLSRPVDGIPDPHLHAHEFVQNLTFDPEEKRWKAAQFREVKRDAPCFESLFHTRLARRMTHLGFTVHVTKTGWEIAGISKSILDKFSRRTALIEEMAKEKGIVDQKKKSELGAKTREHKQKNLSMEELRKEWRARLTDDERGALAHVIGQLGGTPTASKDRAAETAARLAADHCFERKSVVPERELLREALKRAYGACSVEEVKQAVAQCHLVTGEREGRQLVTTREVLSEETRMIRFARDGRGTCDRLGSSRHVFSREWLNDGQRKAVKHILTSRDRVTLVRGAAGTGKTSMMKEAIEAIEAGGNQVFTFAPSADASRGVLVAEGFKNAETVARLLLDEKLQQRIKGQVIWIDEAGLLGSRQMLHIFDMAEKLDARLILAGDRFQHGAVERGAALRLLETEAGLIPAELRDIQRQKDEYKHAVQALSEQRTEDGFAQLDNLGWIKELPDAERYKVMARDYLAALAEKKSALVVSPTHAEGALITKEIRAGLKSTGSLGTDERTFSVLENANFTRAERSDARNFTEGDVLLFHQNARGYIKGDKVVVGKEPLPLDQADRFEYYRPAIMQLAPGDLLRVTRNGKTKDDLHRLNNGSIYTVKGFGPTGDIVLTNDWTIGKDYGNLAHGYVVTSHKAQGKDVKRVFIGQSAHSFPASSKEQFYVSASRAREKVVIYTSNKEALLEAVNHSDDRLSATEFVNGRKFREKSFAVQRNQNLNGSNRHSQNDRKRKGMNYER